MSDLEDRILEFGRVTGMARDAAALLAVAEVGAFDALRAGPLTADQIGERCSVSQWRIRAFLDRVAANGFLVKDGETYALVPGDAVLFDPEAGYTGRLGFADVGQAFGRLSKSVEVLRSDQTLPMAGSGGDAPQEERERFLRYLHGRSSEGAVEVAQLLCAEPVSSVVDLGCGLGTYAAAVLKEAPSARATLVDRANAEQAITSFFAEEGLSERATFVGGDVLESDFGGGFDLALVGNLVHNLGEADSRALLRRLRSRMAPGGRVVVKDVAVDADRLGPESVGRFALWMALFTDRGGVFPAGEVEGWLVDAGFTLERTIDLTVAEGSYLVIGRV